MRVIEADPSRAVCEAPDAALRPGRIELLALVACSAVVVFGIWLTYAGRTARLVEADAGAARVLALDHLAGADDFVPLLTMFDDDRDYHVVRNDEDQYSIWPIDLTVPAGWVTVGRSGPKPECLAYIKEVWTDMRPLSLRKKMEESAAGS